MGSCLELSKYLFLSKSICTYENLQFKNWLKSETLKILTSIFWKDKNKNENKKEWWSLFEVEWSISFSFELNVQVYMHMYAWNKKKK